MEFIINLIEKYHWTIKEIEIEDIKGNNQLSYRRVINIVLYDKESGIFIPHPITNFIRRVYDYPGKSLSSQRNSAREITKFLNYLYERISLKDENFIDLKSQGISGLKIIHGVHYLNYLTDKVNSKGIHLSYKYVKNIESYLLKFYQYLFENGFLKDEINFEQSPFRRMVWDLRLPNKNAVSLEKLKDFSDSPFKRNQMVYEFLEVAKYIAPEIAFGIGLQIWGGLRRGEVVNLTRSSIGAGFLLENNVIYIEDNQNKLFSHLKNTDKEQVKRPRTQVILGNDLLKDLYINHMKRIDNIKCDNILALFVTDKGKTISGASYEKIFNKVKLQYIEWLYESSSRYLDFKRLTDYSWGSHIGRGIFTSYLFEMGMREQEIAIARGDRSTKSAKDYIDYKTAFSQFNIAIQQISAADKKNIKNFLQK